ncbi:MAG: hypothetical protein COA85_00565 [Robiginitomaculum sp.]|nr:MAG: hypothetical protein COA85_00565 [Robiginitomaculum sp.]
MPFVRQFDFDTVLHDVMQVFWRQGYRGTSIQDLTKKTGLKPGSIYAAFGNKRGLFAQSLLLYHKMFTAHFDSLLDSTSPLSTMRTLFEGVVEDALQDPDYCGCLLVNTSLDLVAHDRETAEQVGKGFEATEQFFFTMVEKAKAAGEVSPHVNVRHTAQHLLAQFIGLRVLSRGYPDPVLLHTVVEEAFKTLR